MAEENLLSKQQKEAFFLPIPPVPVFQGITEQEWAQMEAACPVARRLYEKGQTIFRQGEPAREMGVVLSGAVHIESVDLWGHRTLLSRVGPGQVFGETYALTGGPLLVDAVAAEDCEILAIRLGALLGENHAGASWQGKLLRNLVSIFAGKNRALSHRIFCTSPKTIRGRLVTYLSAQALEQGSSSFSIPFDRQQLADYLGVDRSALSKELGRMRDEGLLETRKNHFLLHRLGEVDS